MGSKVCIPTVSKVLVKGNIQNFNKDKIVGVKDIKVVAVSLHTIFQVWRLCNIGALRVPLIPN